jgi:hypothetical protein
MIGSACSTHRENNKYRLIPIFENLRAMAVGQSNVKLKLLPCPGNKIYRRIQGMDRKFHTFFTLALSQSVVRLTFRPFYPTKRGAPPLMLSIGYKGR